MPLARLPPLPPGPLGALLRRCLPRRRRLAAAACTTPALRAAVLLPAGGALCENVPAPQSLHRAQSCKDRPIAMRITPRHSSLADEKKAKVCNFFAFTEKHLPGRDDGAGAAAAAAAGACRGAWPAARGAAACWPGCAGCRTTNKRRQGQYVSLELQWLGHKTTRYIQPEAGALWRNGKTRRTLADFCAAFVCAPVPFTSSMLRRVFFCCGAFCAFCVRNDKTACRMLSAVCNWHKSVRTHQTCASIEERGHAQAGAGHVYKKMPANALQISATGGGIRSDG